MPAKIKHLVVLMMENRSFDHMLGYLKHASYPIEGLDGDETNPSAAGGPAIRVSPNARSINDLNPDPAHEFPDINVQIFGNPEGADTGQAKMQGFVQNYATHSGNALHGANVMKCFHPGTLPVLSTLAKQYAVCDHWFSSVPGSTLPNRLFAHAATSGGSLTQDAVLAPARAKTIFQIIDDPNNEATYRIYTGGASVLMANIYLAHHQNKFFDYKRFGEDCKDNLLPEYTFIEPVYDDDLNRGALANSQHPDFAVDAGEALIADVYNAVRSSPSWNDTVLLIVYDEHGGLFDHVTPPTLTRDPQYPDIPPTKDFGFRFDRLGVRVPAVFVSPRIKAGTIVRQQFDHCSIVATVRKLFCLDQTPFNWREGQAGTFDGIANLPDDQIRTDTIAVPAPVVSDGSLSISRNSVLSLADRQTAAAAMIAAGVPPVARVTSAGSVTASAPAIVSPPVRKATDLMLLMAQSMQHTLQVMGLSTQKKVTQIYSAQDASDYLREAVAQLPHAGDE
jgi:phospholipase C